MSSPPTKNPEAIASGSRISFRCGFPSVAARLTVASNVDDVVGHDLHTGGIVAGQGRMSICQKLRLRCHPERSDGSGSTARAGQILRGVPLRMTPRGVHPRNKKGSPLQAAQWLRREGSRVGCFAFPEVRARCRAADRSLLGVRTSRSCGSLPAWAFIADRRCGRIGLTAPAFGFDCGPRRRLPPGNPVAIVLQPLVSVPQATALAA
jgi:hypothetical protein